MRVSGGHLCAQHRSTDRGGSRDLEPAASSASPPLAVPKILFGLERRRILTAAPFHTPFIRHWRRSCSMPKASLLYSQIKKAVTFQLLLLFWSRRQDSNLRHLAPKASALPNCATPRFYEIVLFYEVECSWLALSAHLRVPKFFSAWSAEEF